MYDSQGKERIHWDSKSHLEHQVALGEVVKLPLMNGYGALTGYQYRAVEREESESTPSNHSPTSISYHETLSLVGLNGPKAQRAARAKIKAWPTVYDRKCVTVCAGLIHVPENNGPHSSTA